MYQVPGTTVQEYYVQRIKAQQMRGRIFFFKTSVVNIRGLLMDALESTCPARETDGWGGSLLDDL